MKPFAVNSDEHPGVGQDFIGELKVAHICEARISHDGTIQRHGMLQCDMLCVYSSSQPADYRLYETVPMMNKLQVASLSARCKMTLND